MPGLKTSASCWRRAAEAKTQAAQISDQHLKAVYQQIAHQWSGLARSYEFADSAKRFLLDAKRTKNVNARQAIRELVLLPSSLPSGEAKHLLPTHSDGAGSPRRRILSRKITDCRPIKLVAAMSEQRQEPVVQKTG
jgi:hypothetical protein